MIEPRKGFTDDDLKQLVGVGNLIAKLASEVQATRAYNEHCHRARCELRDEVVRLRTVIRELKKKGKR